MGNLNQDLSVEIVNRPDNFACDVNEELLFCLLPQNPLFS